MKYCECLGTLRQSVYKKLMELEQGKAEVCGRQLGGTIGKSVSWWAEEKTEEEESGLHLLTS